jgi:Alr-MurF fusion protein
MNTADQIRKWSQGDWLQGTEPLAGITDLTIDSRSITQPETTLFIALRTPLRNGHQFVYDAWTKGVRNFLVSENVDISRLTASNIILVTDTLAALQAIATGHRQQFDLPVVGITGSNGKTMVKEWLSELLGEDYNVVKNPKSYNSQIGVPLSVWLIRPEHQIGIFEAGISQPNEMERLEHILQPTIGIFTNLGEAHSEGFDSQDQKIREKMRLFAHTGKLIYCSDKKIVREAVEELQTSNKNLALFSWSRLHDAALRVTGTTTENGQTTITAVYKGAATTISIPFTDEASIENAMHCWCLMLLLGIGSSKIQRRMTQLQQVTMRLEMKHGINDCTIINDSYNSDLTSLQLALNYLDQQKQHEKHTVIMSDILQPGKKEEALYNQVATYIGRRKISRFIGIGPGINKHKAVFKELIHLKCYFYKSTALFLKNFHKHAFDQEVILLKGARAFEFEKIGLLLEQKVHQTIMSIDLSALRQNLDVFRGQLKPGVKTMAMVKAFAYGSGSYEIASYLQFAGIDYLAVAYTDEGIALRKAGITTPIMVMSPDSSSFDRMIAWKLEPELYNIRSFGAFQAIAATLGVKDYPVHIKLDTGMHRLGFNPTDLPELNTRIAASAEIKIASIFSHLAASDDLKEDPFTEHQAALFEQMSSELTDTLDYKPLLHLSNSAGISRLKHMQYDMVRLGLGLYGIDGSGKLQNKLRQVSTLRTSIAQIRTVPAGESIGYGHHTITTRDMTIATICIGYADGYPRSMGHGKAYVLINGQKAHTIGIICMDMCMVDITDLPGVKEGDEAIIFSNDLPVTQLAAWAGTISYEIMTGISQRVKRVYTNNE